MQFYVEINYEIDKLVISNFNVHIWLVYQEKKNNNKLKLKMENRPELFEVNVQFN